ncbi:MAG TPA: DUF167 domain-containing protein [Bryobacteraceae bacterium]|nr:DUF167 domain-containing protein [Bryobacteraceae bacterium]
MADLGALKAELERNGRLALTLKVVPKSSRNEIVGFLEDGSLKLKITAAPERGKANAEVCDLLAREFGVSRRSVEIVRGATSRLKNVILTRTD